jgi:hypothetical protein
LSKARGCRVNQEELNGKGKPGEGGVKEMEEKERRKRE